MRSVNKQLLQQIEHEIEKQEQSKEVLSYIHVDLWKQAFPDAHMYWSLASELTIELPMSFELVVQVKEFVEEQFPDWKLVRENQFVWDDLKRAGIFLEYENPTVKLKRTQGRYYLAGHPHLSVDFRSEHEGSTCVLKRIGSRRKTIPILEVVCPEGAQETWQRRDT